MKEKHIRDLEVENDGLR